MHSSPQETAFNLLKLVSHETNVKLRLPAEQNLSRFPRCQPTIFAVRRAGPITPDRASPRRGTDQEA
ncbi:hypothetical protein I546_5539 [Mycobacterium kansasii 732]|nr:hypothetical protein I546_5539 [Mycobacterium kansasii 732]